MLCAFSPYSLHAEFDVILQTGVYDRLTVNMQSYFIVHKGVYDRLQITANIRKFRQLKRSFFFWQFSG